ncbi:hypothetical protein P0Y35_08505 [Kiritimatiellaeota bacterium B1221]|nr:hypothetical protein [Kiritimatiellaeota bacterium B1221]
MNVSAIDDDPDSYDSTMDSLEDYEDLYNQNRELLEAIHQLEENLPEVEDPVGIYTALFDIYSEMENMSEAGNCLTEAARRVEPGEHEDLIYFLYNQLELFAQLSPDAQSAYEHLGQYISQDDGSLDANTLFLDQRKLYQVDLIPEILLANHLHRSRIISDQEYYLTLQDLCWLTSNEPTSPRACLYVLSDRDLPHQDKALEFLAHDAATPYIDLALIKTDDEYYEALPRDFCVRRAACVFGEVGGEPLVAMLNPFNLQLKQDISRLLDSEPHFFVTSAPAFQAYLERQLAAMTP